MKRGGDYQSTFIATEVLDFFKFLALEDLASRILKSDHCCKVEGERYPGIRGEKDCQATRKLLFYDVIVDLYMLLAILECNTWY